MTIPPSLYAYSALFDYGLKQHPKFIEGLVLPNNITRYILSTLSRLASPSSVIWSSPKVGLPPSSLPDAV